MRRRHAFFVVLFAGLVLAGPLQAQPESSSSDRTIQVVGEATVKADPDRATVRFGIVSRAETAEAARAQNAKAAARAMNTVRELGISDSQMRMETLRLQPRREYNPQTETREEKGFEATRQVVVQVDDLEQLPTLVARVVQRGANRLDGISYELEDRSAIRERALRTAAHHARDKARLLAASLDVTLGAVREIIEQSFDFSHPQPNVRMEFAESEETDAASEPDAYAPGEIEVSAQVRVVYEIESEPSE